MAKEYEFIGALPVTIPGYGRCEPDTGRFRCELDPEWEAFALKAGILRVVRELEDGAKLSRAPKDSATWPTSWPRTPREQVADGVEMPDDIEVP